MNKEDVSSTVFLIHGLLSPSECAELIVRAADEGVEDQDFGHSGRPDVRGRGALEAPAITDMLSQRLLPFAPSLDSVYAHGMKPQPKPNYDLVDYRPSGLNPRLRFYRYYPGQRFPRHFDIAFEASDATRSFLTVIIYLNEDAIGGETIFTKHIVSPKLGSALVFPHELQHQGGQVSAGVKWVLRTDIMYTAGERTTKPMKLGRTV